MTDDVAGQHAQIIKLAHGALDSATLVSLASGLPVQGQAAHDAVLTGVPVIQGGYASAAAPADVSADADAVRAWYLRNGAAATVITAAGALIGGDAANGLDVDVTRVTGTVTIAGAVTNAGTFAVQDAAAEASLSVLDDWDETNRAAVNTIAGQVGVQGASGVVTALTQRVVLATDVALPAGTNGIGKLTANSGVDIGDVDVTSIAAGTNLIGRVAALPATSTIYDGTTAVTPVFAVIDVASSGDNTLVAADATKKIRVFSLFMIAAGTVTARFESAAGGTAKTGQMNLVANTGFVLPFNPLGWFETAANELLNLELSAAISVDGCFQYGLI